MQKIATVFLLLLLITSQTTTADTPTESEQTINATARFNASSVKITSTTGTGSGFFIAPHSILTNEHVVHHESIGDSVNVYRKDKSSCGGTVVYKDETTDLALISTTCTGTPLQVTEKVQEGQTIIVVGNPLGFDFTTFKGIISGLNYTGYIQCDAKIASGNSGGVLGNLDGEVVGIVTRGANNNEYIGFALNGKVINRFLDRVRKTQTIE